MGIFDRFRKKKKDDFLDVTALPPATAQPLTPGVPTVPGAPVAVAPTSSRAEIDLIASRLENLRMQYEAISVRLQNIERLVTEIRSFCK